jgi:hypothetical protein
VRKRPIISALARSNSSSGQFARGVHLSQVLEREAFVVRFGVPERAADEVNCHAPGQHELPTRRMSQGSISPSNRLLLSAWASIQMGPVMRADSGEPEAPARPSMGGHFFLVVFSWWARLLKPWPLGAWPASFSAAFFAGLRRGLFGGLAAFCCLDLKILVPFLRRDIDLLGLLHDAVGGLLIAKSDGPLATAARLSQLRAQVFRDAHCAGRQWRDATVDFLLRHLDID